MTTKRYFYTDPLAAAWMNIKFGMRFSIYSPLDGISKEPEKWNWAWEMLGNRQLPYHVNPESLHLLEPQKNDLVMGPDVGPEIGDTGPAYMELGKMGFTDGRGHFREIVKIIQRNGTAFVWPESE